MLGAGLQFNRSRKEDRFYSPKARRNLQNQQKSHQLQRAQSDITMGQCRAKSATSRNRELDNHGEEASESVALPAFEQVAFPLSNIERFIEAITPLGNQFLGLRILSLEIGLEIGSPKGFWAAFKKLRRCCKGKRSEYSKLNVDPHLREILTPPFWATTSPIRPSCYINSRVQTRVVVAGAPGRDVFGLMCSCLIPKVICLLFGLMCWLIPKVICLLLVT